MQGVAKGLLIAIVVSIGMLLFTNFVFFFPWYATLVMETYHLSQAAANDNYLKESYYEDALDRFENRPIFRDKADKLSISVTNADGRQAIGYDDETYYESLSLLQKPYRQRGNPVTVTISAVYPLKVTLWGNTYERELPVSFSITTTGLKHYKDLEWKPW